MRRNDIQELLPRVFRRTLRPGNPLSGLLEVMEALHQPSEDVLDRLDVFFDPGRAPDAFVPFLARWVDLERLFDEPPDKRRGAVLTTEPLSTGLGRLRQLISAAVFLSQWRGTATGLLAFLEIATGMKGFEIHENVPTEEGRVRAFHVRVRAPAAAAPHRRLIQRIIEQEKPAYVTFELEVGAETRGGNNG